MRILGLTAFLAICDVRAADVLLHWNSSDSGVENVTFCGKDANSGYHYLATDLGRNCFLLIDSTHNIQLYHKIYCYDPGNTDDLRMVFENYAAYNCQKPIKLYIPSLDLKLDSDTFKPISKMLRTLIIKDWNPCVIDVTHVTQYRRSCDIGQPFLHLHNLLLLDISFRRHVPLSTVNRHFLEGLSNLEALIFENLPHNVILENGLFKGKNEDGTLQCVTLIASNISCSCNYDDPMIWLHRWLRKNSDIWGSRTESVVTYSERLTSSQNVFLCEVDLTCSQTLEQDSFGEPIASKVRDFHTRHWKHHCDHHHHVVARGGTPVSDSHELLAPHALQSRSSASGARNWWPPWPSGYLLVVLIAAIQFVS